MQDNIPSISQNNLVEGFVYRERYKILNRLNNKQSAGVFLAIS